MTRRVIQHQMLELRPWQLASYALPLMFDLPVHLQKYTEIVTVIGSVPYEPLMTQVRRENGRKMEVETRFLMSCEPTEVGGKK
jgi:hypothetical protein